MVKYQFVEDEIKTEPKTEKIIPGLPTLKPPKTVKLEVKPRIIPEISEDVINTQIHDSGIDLVKLANSSDFKRLIYLALTGKTWRGKDIDLERKLNSNIKVFRDPSFTKEISELKDNFKNGFTKPSQFK